MNKLPRAVRYIRTNVDGRAQATDIADQGEVCDNVATRHGLTITDTYEDICDPATPALARLITEAQVGRIDIVVCSSMDRLVRHAAKLHLTLDCLDVVCLDVDTREPLDPRSADVIRPISSSATDEPNRRIRRRAATRRGRARAELCPDRSKAGIRSRRKERPPRRQRDAAPGRSLCVEGCDRRAESARCGPGVAASFEPRAQAATRRDPDLLLVRLEQAASFCTCLALATVSAAFVAERTRVLVQQLIDAGSHLAMGRSRSNG